MSIELMDSFEQQIRSKYIAGSMTFSAGSGRGSTHRGAVFVDVNPVNHLTASVSASATKGQAVAVNVNNATSLCAVYSFEEASGAIVHVTIGFDASGHIAAWRGTTSGTLLGTSSAVVATPGSFVHIESKVLIDGTVGTVEVRANEVAVLTLTGQNTKNGGTGTCDQCTLGATVGYQLFTFFDDYIIWNTSGTLNNTFLGDVRVGYSAANVAGTYTDGTAVGDATLLACVDDIAFDGDTTYINFDDTALPKAASFAVEDAPTNATQILAVAPLAIVRKDDAGTDNGRVLLISGATENDGGGVDVPATSSYTLVTRIHETDPNTSVAWTVSNFNAIQVGWRRTA